MNANILRKYCPSFKATLLFGREIGFRLFGGKSRVWQSINRNELSAAHSPSLVEQKWYEHWEKLGLFRPERNKNVDDKFVMLLPPPNVTGTLHLGHALTIAIEDSICRWKRMSGKEVLWIPGCDHAGIATQVVVEKKLWNERKLTRHDVGREQFTKLIWDWKEEKGSRILEQMRLLGAGLDWTRSYFTLDEARSNAVQKAFLQLHRDGLIYRSKRMVNWSSTLQSVISDIEVDSKELTGPSLRSVPGYSNPVEFGVLASFAYLIADSSEEVVVSTTRIETMLGDVAIAVHPTDSRYSSLIGKRAHHPFLKRTIQIVADETVDPAFGTGAVKVTPAHDVNDHGIAVRHGLEIIDILDDRGNIVCPETEFHGMKRFDVRSLIETRLKEKNLFRGKKAHTMSLPVCSRSGDVIEPRIKEQWFLRCDSMAEKAVKAVETGQLKLIPSSYEKTWFDWMNNMRDWCISRQLWWGHRIPAFAVHTSDGVHWMAATSLEEARRNAEKSLQCPILRIEQDPDVLDTWFSSSLLPMSSLGWPKTRTDDFGRYFPTTLLETGVDILFFWVARMAMLSLQLTGQLPFREVLLHGILCDAHGRKMSKSLGNVIDPVHVVQGVSLQSLQSQLDASNLSQEEIEKAKEGMKKDFPNGIPQIGSDALRFALCFHDFKELRVNVDVNTMIRMKHFCNKIWQAFRFCANLLPDDFKPVGDLAQLSDSLTPIDAWFIGRLNATIVDCNKHFENYDLHLCSRVVHDFFYHDFCDVYLECCKPRLRQQGQTQASADVVLHILHVTMDTSLRLLHPFMPSLTEELYQRLPACGEDSILKAAFPKKTFSLKGSVPVADVDEGVRLVKEIARKILHLKHEYNLKNDVQAVVACSSEQMLGDLALFHKELEHLSKAKQLRIVSKAALSDDDRRSSLLAVVSSDCEVYVPVQGVLNVKAEMARMDKKMAKLEANREKAMSRTRIPEYETKTPEHVRAGHRAKIAEVEFEMRRLKEQMVTLTRLE